MVFTQSSVIPVLVLTNQEIVVDTRQTMDMTVLTTQVEVEAELMRTVLML